MRRSVWFWTGVLLVGYALRTFAADWAALAAPLNKSVVYIETKGGSCTGFVINAHATNKDREDVDYILTAAHCNGAEMYADQTAAKVLWLDTKKDLMVLEVSDLNRPALKLAKDNPKIGDEVASFGYGWGLERPMFRTAHVSDDDTYIPEDGIGGPFIVIDAQFVSGQSGGPVINLAGEVALIVQRGGSGVGIGVGAETIRNKTGKYWEKPKPPKP
jgi:S1-C subfamily serine protease